MKLVRRGLKAQKTGDYMAKNQKILRCILAVVSLVIIIGTIVTHIITGSNIYHYMYLAFFDWGHEFNIDAVHFYLFLIFIVLNVISVYCIIALIKESETVRIFQQIKKEWAYLTILAPCGFIGVLIEQNISNQQNWFLGLFFGVVVGFIIVIGLFTPSVIMKNIYNQITERE
jgi:hypothetical protein